jgi:hypothetical protein
MLLQGSHQGCSWKALQGDYGGVGQLQVDGQRKKGPAVLIP